MGGGELGIFLFARVPEPISREESSKLFQVPEPIFRVRARPQPEIFPSPEVIFSNMTWKGGGGVLADFQ